MNIKQNTLAALLVLGIGMSGCNNSDSNPTPPTVDKKTDQTTENNRTVVTENNITTTVDKNKTTIVDKNVTITIEGNQTIVKEGNKTTIVDRNLTTESNVTIIVDKNGTKVTDGNDTIIVDKNGTKITDGNDTTVITNPSGENNDTDKKPPVENNNTDENRTATILGYIGSQHSNHNSTITVAQLREITPALSNIIASNLNSYRSYIEDPRANFSTPATIAQVQIMLDTVNTSKSVLGSIGNQHSNGSSDITVAQLKTILPALRDINDDYQDIYQTYIASADTNISSPATLDEVQSMINEVNDFNLPEHAILDRSFFKKTNGAFEHRFVYLPVENTTTGRTWLNNNLGAEYANVDSSAYNASQQATAGNDYLAYGSLFQWGRKADGHELFDWTGATAGTAKHGDTNVTNDNPSDSLFIKQRDWRVNQDDTLWASESSPNNVCPVGYRLPLNPNGAVDGEHELAVEINSWNSKNVDGAMSSVLKLTMAGGRWTNGDRAWTARYGFYWSGSVVASDGNNSTVSNTRDVFFGGYLDLFDTSARGDGLSVRCIKDQTPAERSATILKMIGNEHSNDKSTVTVAQLKAILPALENINDNYLDIYHSYIVSADKSFSSPATRDEVQKMITDINDFITKNSSSPTLTDIATQHSNGSSTITAGTLNQISILGNALPSNEKWYQSYIGSDTHFSSPAATLLEVQRMINEVNSFNIPTNAVLDKNFFKKTRGKFEHRFVYLPVTNPTTGKTWLNNNLGAWYANAGRNMYDPSQQATNANDNYAKGSLFQWGRKADGHEIVGWWYNNGTIAQLATTTTKSDNPTDGKFIAVGGDWRVHPDDDLWKGIDAPNNPCPAHYRVPTKEDLDTEAQTWDSLSSDGSMSSLLKIPGPGWLGTNGYTMYSPGGEPRLWYASGGFAWTPKRIDPTQRTDGQPVRCIKD